MCPIVKILLDHPQAKLPARATPGSAGLDLHSVEKVNIPAGRTAMINTGLRMCISTGYEGQVRSRSGLAKMGIVVANSPGTIDSDYRGVVRVLLRNNDYYDFEVHVGDRIAQLVVAPIWTGDPDEVRSLDETQRGDGGFGSTGS